MGKGTQNAQMQGSQHGAPYGQEWPSIEMAEGPSMGNYDGLSRVLAVLLRLAAGLAAVAVLAAIGVALVRAGMSP